MAFGRPSKYDPEFCEAVIDAGAEGKTLAGMAEAIDVDRSTLNEWMAIHDDFSRAVKRGLQKAQALWEDRGTQGTFGGIDGFNATSYIFQMKNRFKEDWADIQGREHSGPGGKPMETVDLSAAALMEEARKLGIDPATLGITAPK